MSGVQELQLRLAQGTRGCERGRSAPKVRLAFTMECCHELGSAARFYLPLAYYRGWHTGDKNSVISGFDPSANPPKAGKCNEVVQVQVPDLAALNAKGYAVAAVNYRLTGDPVAARPPPVTRTCGVSPRSSAETDPSMIYVL